MGVVQMIAIVYVNGAVRSSIYYDFELGSIW